MPLEVRVEMTSPDAEPPTTRGLQLITLESITVFAVIVHGPGTHPSSFLAHWTGVVGSRPTPPLPSAVRPPAAVQRWNRRPPLRRSQNARRRERRVRRRGVGERRREPVPGRPQHGSRCFARVARGVAACDRAAPTRAAKFLGCGRATPPLPSRSYPPRRRALPSNRRSNLRKQSTQAQAAGPGAGS
jgi:hypothetical protein